jgi:hypothetical protein
MDWPESTDAVALALREAEQEQEPKGARRRNIPETARLLDLFAECLRAVNGDRCPIDSRPPTQWLN